MSLSTASQWALHCSGVTGTGVITGFVRVQGVDVATVGTGTDEGTSVGVLNPGARLVVLVMHVVVEGSATGVLERMVITDKVVITVPEEVKIGVVVSVVRFKRGASVVVVVANAVVVVFVVVVVVDFTAVFAIVVVVAIVVVFATVVVVAVVVVFAIVVVVVVAVVFVVVVNRAGMFRLMHWRVISGFTGRQFAGLLFPRKTPLQHCFSSVEANVSHKPS
jgi:hypothetical protein